MYGTVDVKLTVAQVQSSGQNIPQSNCNHSPLKTPKEIFLTAAAQ